LDELENFVGIWTCPREDNNLLLVIDLNENQGKRVAISGLIHPYPFDYPRGNELLNVDSTLKQKLALEVIGPRTEENGLCVMPCGILRIDTLGILGRMYFDGCWQGDILAEDPLG
jgi:hypothetical protein